MKIHIVIGAIWQLQSELEVARISSKCHDAAVRHLNYFRESSAAALLALGLSASVSAQTNALPEIPATEATNYLNQQVIVTDKVAQVVIRPTLSLLHLNQTYPNSPLTGVVRGDYTNNFPNFESYLDKHVEITGRITVYRGRWEIVLTSTNQIKIVNATEINSKPWLPAVELQTQGSSPQQPATAIAAATQPVTQVEGKPDRAVGWILGLMTGIIALLAFGIFLFWRRNPGDVRTMPVARALAESSNDMAAGPLSVQEWKQRALVAEAMAGKQGQMLREKIMPELTEFAKQSLVQGLYAQRNALIETQQKAQQALTELESRLGALQLPLQERIRAYEKRIVELEKEVETQGEEVRELTRATLTLVRKKLEDERQTERAQNRFN